MSAPTSGDGTINVEKREKDKPFRKFNPEERLEMLGLPQTILEQEHGSQGDLW